MCAQASNRQGKGMGKNGNYAYQASRYKEDDKDFPGAYKADSKVLGLMRDNVEWRVAEIYKVRKALFFQETVEQDQATEIELYDDIIVTEHPKSSSKD
jgi:hypothetical protein